MKKILTLLLAITLLLTLFAGCSDNDASSTESAAESESPQTVSAKETGSAEETGELQTITVGASITPHAEILEVAKELLVEEGYNLVIKEYTDYVMPNTSLDEGDLDANYFQHQAYLDWFNEEYGTSLASVAAIHYEPFGVYSQNYTSIDEITEGSSVAIPNDGTNEARALLLLEDLGYITLKEDVNLSATVLDIAENTKHIEIIEMEAAQIPNTMADVDFVVMNGNYALQADLTADEDAIATESEDSLAYETYPNVLVVKEGNENDPAIQALVKTLTSEEVRTYIESTYSGSVVPVF